MKTLKRILKYSPFIALATFALVVYAASSYRVNNTVTLSINEHGVCQQVSNASGFDVFIPSNSGAEWTAFRNNPPPNVALNPCYTYSWQTDSFGACSVSCGTGTQFRSVWCQRGDGVTVDDSYCGGGKPATSQACDMGACCAPNAGQSCTSGANNCGTTNSGTYQCGGTCSATTPADVTETREVCGAWYCANSDEFCDYVCDGSDCWEENCRMECVDEARNCYYETACP